MVVVSGKYVLDIVKSSENDVWLKYFRENNKYLSQLVKKLLQDKCQNSTQNCINFQSLYIKLILSPFFRFYCIIIYL